MKQERDLEFIVDGKVNSISSSSKEDKFHTGFIRKGIEGETANIMLLNKNVIYTYTAHLRKDTEEPEKVEKMTKKIRGLEYLSNEERLHLGFLSLKKNIKRQHD